MRHASEFGKGAIQAPGHITRSRYVLKAAPAAIDWSIPYDVEGNFTVRQRDQKTSSSCTAQATCYYGEALEYLQYAKTEYYSARFNYSQSYLPGGGAYIWKAMSIPLKVGLADANSVPDGDITESTMENGSLNKNARIEARTYKYAVIPNSHDISSLGAVLRQYGGFITGFNGQDGMFDTKGVISVPSSTSWGHSVWVCGYLTLPDGHKALKFKNSWTSAWGDNGYGYLPEDFVKSGLMFDAYVYANIEDLDTYRLVSANKDVFRLKNGVKDLFLNKESFDALDGRWDKIEHITQGELDAIPDGFVLIAVKQE